MPTYEYQCSKCKRVFEQLQSFSDKPLTKCIFEGCNGKVERLISSGAGVIFKGSGFYETDYKNKSSNGSSSRSKSKAASCPAAEGKSCDSCPNASSD